MLLRAEPADQNVAGFSGIALRAAGVDIGGGVSRLRPRVNRDMRFRQQADDGDALRCEVMPQRADDVCPGRPGSFPQNMFQPCRIAQRFRGTAAEFQQAVPSRTEPALG